MANPDRVQVIKWESVGGGGTQTDESPTEINPNEDALDSRGLYIQDETSADDDVLVSRDSSGNMMFVDKIVTTPVSLSTLSAGGGLTPSQHAALDQLVHELSEDYYEEYAYTGGKVTSVDVWTSIAKTLKIRDYAYTYSGGKVATETIRQYDGSGSVVETLVYTYSYSGSTVTSVACVRTV